MGHLKNSNNKLVVDAILTKYGKEKLATQGKLDIKKFAISDDGIDYGLYNILHPQGSDYYDVAIKNLPGLEGHSEQYLTMKYLLFSDNSMGDPIISISQMELEFQSYITGSGIKTFNSFAITPSFDPLPTTPLNNIYYVASLTIPEPKSLPNSGGGAIVPPTPIRRNTDGPAMRGVSNVTEGSGGTTGTTGQTNVGSQFNIIPVIDDDIGKTDAIRRAEILHRDTNRVKYAVGHSFKFQVKRFGTSSVILPLTITPYGISGKPKTIHIKLVDRDSADGTTRTTTTTQ